LFANCHGVSPFFVRLVVIMIINRLLRNGP
jgi:hypothetical protein